MNEVIQILLYILLLAISTLSGFVIAKYTKDELKQGKKWFLALMLIGIFGALLSLLLKRIAEAILLFSIASIAFVSWKKAR